MATKNNPGKHPQNFTLMAHGDDTAVPVRTEIGPGLFLALPMRVHVTNADFRGLDIVLTIDMVDGKLTAVGIAAPVGLTAQVLRRLAPQDLVRSLVQHAVSIYAELPGRVDAEGKQWWTLFSGMFAGLTEDDRRIIRLEGPTDANVKVAADLYRLAVALDAPPTKHVANTLGLPTSTAGFWVRRARDLGYLPEVEQ